MTFKENVPFFRSSNTLDNIFPVLCEDTGKEGRYFSSTLFNPLGMMLEYNMLLNIGIYININPICIYSFEKYSFREIEPTLFFDENGNFIPNVDVPEYLHLSHFDNQIGYIHPSIIKIIEKEGVEDYLIENSISNEIFLNKNDLKSIRLKYSLVPSPLCTLDKIEEYLKSNCTNIENMNGVKNLLDENLFILKLN